MDGQFWLTPHTFVCEAEGDLVLLDLKRDRYLALARASAAGLAARIDGWPRLDPAGQTPAAASVQTLLTQLLQRGLLTSSRALGKSARAVSVSAPTSTLEGRIADVSLTPSHAIAFVSAALSAALSLRYRSLERTIRAVSKRKHRFCTPVRPDPSTVATLLAIFERLRVYVFTANRRCLFDSLALLNFLAWHGHFPEWVFGVRLYPFAAHCWVTSGAVVYNDTPERVGGYTPILVV